jgi:hypothetical protein
MSSISVQAVQLLRDEHPDEDYKFQADVSEIPATINQEQAIQKATAWAIRFYDDLFFGPKASNLWLGQPGSG